MFFRSPWTWVRREWIPCLRFSSCDSKSGAILLRSSICSAMASSVMTRWQSSSVMSSRVVNRGTSLLLHWATPEFFLRRHTSFLPVD